ncbi:hypothetical protein H6F74_11155 [Trichocoleus sp. FACHB-90]|uniref:hypothetical protein n=1 Tax=Cyanophyceae TaxID=3028117 RepID=UPI00168661DF|nr:hypothetical protein [Trichocoleus sp. FACHB-90]MBD1926800.1 hypothetical protein [Trichocoleus sp. FACHB-90]
MNSDLDNNSEAIDNRFLAWLLKDSNPTAAEPPQDPNLEGDSVEAMELDYSDPLDSEDLSLVLDHLDEAAQGCQPLNLGGEKPTVQNRFHALLKRKLQVEIERNPPLFPWETEICNYEPDYLDREAESSVPLWIPQLSNFSLPVTLPETVLTQLLDSCQEVVQSPLAQGAKLVRAASALFPEQRQTLNQLAGMVLLYPTRSPQEQQFFTNRYEEATDSQQMALSLLAAREIIKALTLPVSPDSKPVERHWQTSLGIMSVQAEYQVEGKVPRCRIVSRLPRGGSLTLRTAVAEATAQRSYPGYLSVESFDLEPNQTYPLEIRLSEVDQPPLIFAIAISS